MRHWHEIPEMGAEIWNDYEKRSAFFANLSSFECCKNCYFYRWGGHVGGDCLRYAPAVKRGETYPNDWCGEFKSKHGESPAP